MPQSADPSIGYDSEFWLGTSDQSSSLTALVGVFDMGLPDEQFGRVEVTHYKSPGKRKQYIDGLIESGTFQVKMNYAPGSATDLLIQAAKDGGTARAFKQVLPDAAGSDWAISGHCVVRGYERTNPLEGRREATITCELTDDPVEGAGS